jgi:hypothetical protein
MIRKDGVAGSNDAKSAGTVRRVVRLIRRLAEPGGDTSVKYLSEQLQLPMRSESSSYASARDSLRGVRAAAELSWQSLIVT